MVRFSLVRPISSQVADLAAFAAEQAAAAVYLTKAGGAAVKTHALSGELQLSSSGWGLLKVPNALVRGAFDALDELGAELPLRDGRLNAHVSVLRPEDIERIGGADKVHEFGHHFRYTLGPVKEVEPAGWPEMSKVWFIEIESPELKQFRKSYGLSALPKDDAHPFHITVAVKKKNVLKPGDDVVKHANDQDRVSPENRCPKCPTGTAVYPRSYPERKSCKVCYHQWTGETKIAETDRFQKASAMISIDEVRAMGREAFARAMDEYMSDKNTEDRDSGELHLLTDKERKRLEAAWESEPLAVQKRYLRRCKDAECERGPEVEHCPHCDARLERDPHSGTCNHCGKDWPQKEASIEKAARLLTLADGSQRDHDELARELADRLMKAADDDESRLLHNTMLGYLRPLGSPEERLCDLLEAYR